MKKNKELQISSIPQELDFSYFKPVEIVVLNNNFDRALKIFRSLVQSERILSEYKQKQSYEKPSEKRRRKINESKQRAFEAEMKQQKIDSGEYEKELVRKQLKREKKKLLRANNITDTGEYTND